MKNCAVPSASGLLGTSNPHRIRTIPAVGNLGENLRAAREKRELTQERLAELSGVQAGEISRIETGKRDPQVSTVLKLAKGLELAPGKLLE
jgi:predicted transcriptional regulator